MRLRRGKRFAILCLAFLGLGPVAAHADPIIVTGGVVSLLGPFSEPAGAQLSGDGLRLNGDGFGGAFTPVGLQPGDVGTVNGSFSFSAGHPFQVVVDNQAYDAFLAGTLTFVSAPFVFPQVPAIGIATYQAPFSMTGRIQGFTTFFHAGETPLFDVGVAGRGTLAANQQFSPGFGSGPNFGVGFRFEPVSATPEPTSLILLGSGVAGLLLRSRKRM